MAPVFWPFYQKLLDVLALIEKNINLPLLSTPTHHPCWIDPKILVERIEQWQHNGESWSHIDLQLALSRTWLGGAEKIIPTVKKELGGEVQNLLCFLLEKEASPVGPFETIAHWWTAAITKNPETVYPEFEKFIYAKHPIAKWTGAYPWEVKNEIVESTEYSYEAKKRVPYTYKSSDLKIDFSADTEGIPVLKAIFNWSTTPKEGQTGMVYGCVEFKREWFSSHPNDEKRFYSLVPNNPEKLFAKIIYPTLRVSYDPGVDAKHYLINTLEHLLLHPLPFGKMGHLLIAGSMICADKTARSLAGELWIRGVNYDFVDSARLGAYIGKHFYVEFAPLKRFTDLVEGMLMGVSTKHNHMLQILLENVLAHMNEKPIRGLKKLLEIYLEVKQKNKANASRELHTMLTSWKASKGLHKVLNLITESNSYF